MEAGIERQWRDHYNRTARSYDRKEWLWGFLLGYSDMEERRSLVERLRLQPGQRLLEVNAGTGTNLALAARLGSGGRLVAQDISVETLTVCREKLLRQGTKAELVESDIGHLPFPDDRFDAVLSFGGISQFGDAQAAISEMVRVARPGARVVIGDVGVQPDRRTSVRNKLVIRANPRYAAEPPTDLLPTEAAELHVSWFRNGTCYVIDFIKTQSK